MRSLCSPFVHGAKRPIGVIEPGAAADLVVIDEELRTTRVLHNGTWV